jgi:hypothetical protein
MCSKEVVRINLPPRQNAIANRDASERAALNRLKRSLTGNRLVESQRRSRFAGPG